MSLAVTWGSVSKHVIQLDWCGNACMVTTVAMVEVYDGWVANMWWRMVEGGGG